MQGAESGNPPRVGMLATVRNRRGLITSVEPFDHGPEGVFNLAEREEEIRRRKAHYEELREQLQRERVVKHILPKRYALCGNAQVFPVAVELRLPAMSAY